MTTTHTPDRYELHLLGGMNPGASGVIAKVARIGRGLINRGQFDGSIPSVDATQSDFPRTSTAGLAAIRDDDAATPDSGNSPNPRCRCPAFYSENSMGYLNRVDNPEHFQSASDAAQGRAALHSDPAEKSLSRRACPGADELTFKRFREANVARCLKWHPDGIESWSPSDWLTAVTGELGELASLLKMRNRERDGLPGNKFSPTDKQISDELADVFTYLDLLAAALSVDLGDAAVSKFNEVSERVGFPDRIEVQS